MNKNIFKGCLGLSLTIIIGFVFSIILLIAVGAFLSVGEKVNPVDAIVVLSGDEGERVKEASEWYLKGYGKYLIITKTDNEEIGENKTYSEKMMRIAVEMGVPQDSVLFSEGEASNTIQEANAVLILAKQRNLNSILVITDPYHTRRANIIFDHVFENQEISIFIHGVKNSWYQPFTWFFSVTGWEKTISELGGLFVINQEFSN